MTNKVIAISNDIECSTLFDKISGDLLAMGLVEILEDYTLGRRFETKSRAYNPEFFNEESMKVHGFSFWKAMTFPTRKESLIKLHKWFEPLEGPLPFIQYSNGDFDWQWMDCHHLKEQMQTEFQQLLPRDKTVNVLKMARQNIKHIKQSTKINPVSGKLYTKYSLQNVCDHFGIELDHHEALSDATANALIYCKIMKKEDTWTGEFDFEGS